MIYIKLAGSGDVFCFDPDKGRVRRLGSPHSMYWTMESLEDGIKRGHWVKLSDAEILAEILMS